jgi:hypothetical protein
MPRKKKPKEEERAVQLVQIGITEQPKTVTIKEMFEQLASKEEAMIREARERYTASGEIKALKHSH